jgi:hypothetical protein
MHLITARGDSRALARSLGTAKETSVTLRPVGAADIYVPCIHTRTHIHAETHAYIYIYIIYTSRRGRAVARLQDL